MRLFLAKTRVLLSCLVGTGSENALGQHVFGLPGVGELGLYGDVVAELVDCFGLEGR